MPLTIEQVNGRILQWRDGISHNMEQIRRSQDELLLQVGAEHMPYALTAMAAMMAKGGIIVSTTNNTSIGNAGVAVTGGEVHGNVSGTAQHNTTQTQNQALD